MSSMKPSGITMPAASKSNGKKAETPRAKRQRVWQLVKKAVPQFAKERRELFARNAAYCKLCILDAFQGRLSNGLANNSKKSWWIYTIFCVQTSELLFQCVMGACTFHTISIFFEPENACANSTIYTLLQVLVLLVYSFDIALKMSYEGIEEYFSHDWQQLYVIVTILCALDLAVNRCTLYANPLRPVVGVLRARKGRRFFEVLKKMMPGMTHSLVPLLFFIVIVMVMSALLFDQTIQDLSSPIFTSYNWFFLIFTNDNFNRILPDAVLMNMSYLIFFFPCIYVGQQFLLSLIIGDTYETYKAFVKKQLKKEKLKEMQGLTKAFSALDTEKTGSISAIQWKECCNKYDPTIPDEAVALYFELLSGGNNVISVLQFLNMRSVLNFNLKLRANRKAMFSSVYLPVWNAFSGLYTRIQLPTPGLVSSACQGLLAIEKDWDLLLKLNALDLVALCFSLSDHMLGPFNLPVTGEVMLSVGLVINLCYLLELAVRIGACEGVLHKVHDNNNNTSALFVLGVAGRCVISLAQYVYGVPNDMVLAVPLIAQWGLSCAIPLHKLKLLFRALRCMRVTNINRDLRNFSMALLDVLPALVETFTFSFIVTYIFGAIGNLLFGMYMEDWRSPLRAVVKAQQLTFMVDFLSSTEAAMEQVHPTAALFFVFYLILTLAVSNIALSIIIELQNNMLAGKTSKDRDGQKAKLELMFNKIKDQARARAVFTSRMGAKMNFSNIIMSQFQSSDTRHFIADMDGEKDLKLEDIKQCQKYSSIDLVGHYTKEHRNHNDQHWEVDFLAAVSDAGIKDRRTYKHGDKIFTAGDPADEIFLVVSGCVMVTEPACLGHIYASTAFFVGQEAISPHATYRYDCMADSDSVLLAFTRKDITERLDADLCGCILRMGLKSSAKLEAALQESRKRASRSATQAWGSDDASTLDDEDMPGGVESSSSKSSHRGITLEKALQRENSFELDTSSSPLKPHGAHASHHAVPVAVPLGGSPHPKDGKDGAPTPSRAPGTRDGGLGSRQHSSKENLSVTFNSNSGKRKGPQ